MLINSYEINKNKNIMVYMGSYIKDRSEGKYNDVITYDGDIKANYKSYINIQTGYVCNIDIEDCTEFENKNFIIKMQGVIDNNFDSYLVNYTNIKNWYLKQLETRSEEDVIEELREKYEKKLGIAELKRARENLKNIELELSKISEQRKVLEDKISKIQNNCNHEVVVKTSKSDFSDKFLARATCLICGQFYSSLVSYDLDKLFKNIIHFEDKKFSNLSDEEKVDIAYKMFEEEREANKELSDSKIVEIINDKLKNEKDDIKGKVLNNKPDSVN